VTDDDGLPVLGDDVPREPDLLLAPGAELLEGALELALQRRRLAHDVAGELGERAPPADVAAGAVHVLLGRLPRRRAGRGRACSLVVRRSSRHCSAAADAVLLGGPGNSAFPRARGPVLLVVQQCLRNAHADNISAMMQDELYAS
jgi:hypothetical protein